MSSAALQTTHHQPAALAASPVSSHSNRQYKSSPSPPSVEAYYAQQPNSSARRPPSSKTSGQAQDPSYDLAPAVGHSAAIATSATSAEQRPSTSNRHSNMPPVAPPRTSSNQQSASSRRATYSNDKMNNSPRRGQPEGSRTSSRGESSSAADGGHRSRRVATANPSDATGRSTTSKDGRPNTATMPIRSAQATPSKHAHEMNDGSSRPVANAEDVNGRDRATQHREQGDVAPPPIAGATNGDTERRGTRSRHDHSRSQKGTSRFGDFILGNTIGEGEFGKVKLGWKQDSTVQVAIKLIKRDNVGGNPSRFAKIYREVAILRGVQHPNIVRLIDKVETDRHIGIILEYASGGELFDYILNHRYLKDQAARRLFAQLVSGVGYLHKKGIVHRDLKLENLLLDRNRNIIITDFGFANTFDPNEELSDEEEINLTDREFVKRVGLDRLKPNGTRKGDLMQTSCGSPCYAAPELVVSDSLYTGRKVDVWSCGVILYAMLAGYLPFDDDPANPEGDNINLLYKYIVTTPLTFPEYVTPHARDLLRRILVPNPRKRADLFEVARHSWLSEYAQLVEFITSSTTLPSDVQNSSAPLEEYTEAPLVSRSASVREAPKQKPAQPQPVGGLAKAHGNVDPEAEPAQRTPKDAKRRTVQVEYVAPTTQTQRGAEAAPQKTRARSSSRGPADVPEPGSSRDKPLPREPPVSRDNYSRTGQSKSRPPSSHRNVAAPTRPSRDTRATSDNAYMTGSAAARPQTRGSMQSSHSMGLQSRTTTYGQPAPPAVADTNAQGRIQQPTNAEEHHEPIGRPSISVPPKFAKVSGFDDDQPSQGSHGDSRGHKRSNTLGDLSSKIMGRSGSVFGMGRSRKKAEQQENKSRKYPPVSMSNNVHGDESNPARPSIDSRVSRRSFTLGVSKKRSGSMSGSQGSDEKANRRRFSLLPPSFSLKSIGLGRDYGSAPPSDVDSQQDLPIQDPRRDNGRSGYADTDEANSSAPYFDAVDDRLGTANSSPVPQQRQGAARSDDRRRPAVVPAYMQSGTHYNGSESSVDTRRQNAQGFSESEASEGRRGARGNRAVLQKSKRLGDAYEQDDYRGHEGSSGAAKRVMDFFRRRGKARGGEDRQ